MLPRDSSLPTTLHDLPLFNEHQISQFAQGVHMLVTG
jgi:hypothetical protein